MKRKKMPRPAAMNGDNCRDDAFDFTALLHPAQAFCQPMEVVNDPELTLSEKRALLAAWASDACAVEAVPALRCAPGRSPAQFDDIMDALRVLDQQASDGCKPLPHYRRVLERRSSNVPMPVRNSRRRDESDDEGHRLH
jgi:hypothetical protein